MLFNSLAFVVFFPVLLAGYFLLPSKYRNLFLLAGSCYFYMYFNPVYILILIYTIVVDYYAGIKIEQQQHRPKHRKYWLWASLFANIGALVFFKYADFLLQNVFTLLQTIRPEMAANSGYSSLHILLPIGLSFHTFQAISYTIEVYRGQQPAEKNFIVYALYVMFFPQLVAGPIERPQRLLHQFKQVQILTYENFSVGMKWILWGLFKKIVVADNLAGIVDAVYNNPQQYHGWALVIATVLFAFQIYGDFSGYSDIARGTARVMGFELMINFNLPYFAINAGDFWRRWHISLSTWFKDYVYIPLGGRYHNSWRNTLITFSLSGIWHGANFTYLVWGFLNGVLVLFPRIIKTGTLAWPTWVRIVITFVCIDFCWIFFRANSLKDAYYIISHCFISLDYHSLLQLEIERHVWLVSIAMLLFMVFVEWLSRHHSVIGWWQQTTRWKRIVFLNILLLLMLFFGVFEHRTFIYFQF